MSEEAIIATIEKTCGYDTRSIGMPALKSAIRQRMSQCGCADLSGYAALLASSKEERLEITRLLIVPETWFFRQRNSFVFLANHAFTTWLPAGRKIRILSAACSTGEEPYSIAITMIECGFLPGQFEVHAVDINDASLQKAVVGLYRTNSFREENIDFRNRYFAKTTDGFQLNNEIQKTVHFQKMNLFEVPALPAQRYDAIFCRNLLIYLNIEFQKTLLRGLKHLLLPEALLFLGHAETGIARTCGLASAGPVSAFVFQPESALPGASAEKHLKTRTLKSSTSQTKSMQTARAQTGFLPSEKQNVRAPGRTTLRDAAKLADQGFLLEAENICMDHLDQDPTNTEAHMLLGFIQMAAGRSDVAERHFNKVLFLRPDHTDALLNLALIREHFGDTASAELLRTRAARAAGRSTR